MSNQDLTIRHTPMMQSRAWTAASLANPGVIMPEEILFDGGTPLITGYWHVVRRHLWIVVSMAIIGLLGGMFYSLAQVPTYRAATLIEIQGLNDNFLNIRDISPVAEWPFSNIVDDVQTQIKILQSRTLLERVVSKLNIREPADLGANAGRSNLWSSPPDFGPAGSPAAREMALSIASQNLGVRGVGRTRMVEIWYEATDPKLASAFVNTLADEYIAHNIESRLKMTQQTSKWINGQLDDLRTKLAASEEALRGYTRRSGLVILSETNNVSEDKLRRLQEEITRAQADRMVKQATYELAKNAAPETLPDVLRDDLLRDYQSKLAVLQQEQAELSTAYTPEHSKLKRVNAQIGSLQRSLELQRTALIERIRNQYNEALGREKLLNANYEVENQNLAKEGAKTVEYAMLKRDLDSNRQLYDAMLQRTSTADIASAMRASNARVIDPAIPSGRAVKPNVPLNTAIGFLGSFMAGLLIVAVRERGDQSIRHPGELRSYLGVGELGVIPSAGGRSRSFPYTGKRRSVAGRQLSQGATTTLLTTPAVGRIPEAISSQQDQSEFVRSFRSVVASICFRDAMRGRTPRVIVVTSPNEAEGKTTVASNLAITLSSTSGRVLLIDADVHRPRLHELFGIPNSAGLSDLIETRTDSTPKSISEMLLSHVQDTCIPGLSLLPAGTKGTQALFQTATLQPLIKAARVHFSTVVIDTSPMFQLADARIVGRHADGVVLIVRAGVTTRQSVAAARQRLADDGIEVLGTVLNDWNPRSSPRGHYQY